MGRCGPGYHRYKPFGLLKRKEVCVLCGDQRKINSVKVPVNVCPKCNKLFVNHPIVEGRMLCPNSRKFSISDIRTINEQRRLDIINQEKELKGRVYTEGYN